MSMHAGWGMMRSLTRDSELGQRKLSPGTARRVIGYARPYKSQIVAFLILVILDSALLVATPLLLGKIIDKGVIPKHADVVVKLSLIIAVIAVLDGALTLVQRWYSSRIGEGLIFDLRTQVFNHVLRQPIAFFTRAQTGALVSRLNNDVIGDQQYAERAGRVRYVGIKIALTRTLFLVALTLVASLATAVVYGAGGVMTVNGSLKVGQLVALAALLGRLYGPLTALSNVRVDVMTALVSFERVFEVLDLQPLVQEATNPIVLQQRPVSVEFEGVGFRYPSANEVSLISLETVASGDRRGGGSVLHDVTFSIQPGQMVALVGPSGAGKTTITSLVARLYDPTTGHIRLN